MPAPSVCSNVYFKNFIKITYKFVNNSGKPSGQTSLSDDNMFTDVGIIPVVVSILDYHW